MSTEHEDDAPSPWRDKRFAVFATGNFVNNIGEQVFQVALPLLVYELTGSLLLMSLLVLLHNATLVLGPVLGAIVDRYGPRVLVVPGLLVQLVAAAMLNVVGLAEHAPLWPLFLLAALVELGGEAYRAGWMAGVATMFPDNPTRSRGSLNTLYVASRIGGPLLVVIALTPLGYLGLLWLNVLTFVAPIVVWWLGVHPPRQAYVRAGRTSLRRDIIEGWQIIRQHPTVLHAELVTIPLHFVASTATVVLAIFYLRDHWGMPAQQVGGVLMAINIGALVGVLLVAERKRLRLRRTMTITSVGMASLLFAMALPALWIFVAALVLFYTFRQSMASAGLLMVYKYLPARVVGRANGILDLLDGIPDITAPLVIPLLVPALGVGGTFVMLGITALSSVGWLALTWRRWSDRAVPVPTTG